MPGNYVFETEGGQHVIVQAPSQQEAERIAASGGGRPVTQQDVMNLANSALQQAQQANNVDLQTGRRASGPMGVPGGATMPRDTRSFVGAGGTLPNTAADIARSGWSGLGMGGRAQGMPFNGDVMQMAGDAAGFVAGHMPGLSQQDRDLLRRGLPAAVTVARRASGPMTMRGPSGTPTSGEIAEHPVLGIGYQPQTEPGRWAYTAGSMVPSALAAKNPFGIAANIALPTVGAEGSRLAAHAMGASSGMEQLAHVAGGMAGGMAAGLVNSPSPMQRLVAENASRAGVRWPARPEMTDASIQSTRNLMQQGLDLPNGGVQLAGDEAAIVRAPTEAQGLRALARTATATPAGAPIAGAFAAERPAQVRNATMGVADMIAPPIGDNASLGLRAQGAADQAIRALEAERTAATSPMYQAAGQQMPDQDAVRAALARAIEQADADQTGLLGPLGNAAEAVSPDWDIENLTRYARNLRDNAAIPAGQPGALSREMSGAQGGLANALLDAARANPSQAAADARYAELSRTTVDPALAGPLGQIAPARAPAPPRAADASAAGRALMPNAPPEGHLANALAAVQGMDAQSPGVGAQLTRQRLVDALNEVGQDIQSGPNPMGGANVRANLYGNPYQREVVQGVVDQVAPQARQPLDNLMEVLQATGTRGGPSSPTAPLTQGMKDMGAGNTIMELFKGDARMRSIPSMVDTLGERLRLNQRSQEILNFFQSSPDDFARTLADAIKYGPQANRASVRALLNALTIQ